MKNLYAIVLLFMTSGFLFGQTSDDVLVRIGDRVITVEEFKYRYELTPQVNRKYNDDGKAKEELLYTLIAENLFAIEAEKAGYDTLQLMKRNYIPLEKMHVRDALYKKEISDKVKLDMKKFNEGLVLAQEKLFVDFIFAKDSTSISNAYSQISKDGKFDSLVTLIKNAEYVSDPYEVEYGKMYPHAEEAIYKLKMFEFTGPIKSPEGWYIFRLISKMPVIYKTLDEKISKVKKVVENRVEDSVYNEFWSNSFKEIKVTTDGSLFWYFAEELQKIISDVKNRQNIKDNEKIDLSNSDFALLRNNLHPDSLKKDFIKFEKDPITLEQFVTEFSFESFYTFTTDLNRIAAQLNSRVKRQIELELLTRQGYDLGMENLPEVKNSTDIWRENYLATLYLKDIVLSTELNENDFREYIKESSDSVLAETKVNIIEVLTDSLDVIKEALQIIDNDELLKTYAKKHTKRLRTIENNGEFGEFSISEFGEIGRIASTMEIGDVYGPLETSEGYSLFKIIDKKTVPIILDKSTISDENLRKLKYDKVVDKLENLAADLAEKYNVEINNELLNSLELLNAQMVVYRYMGFGGRILAFPYSSPFFKWKEKWEQKKKDIL